MSEDDTVSAGHPVLEKLVYVAVSAAASAVLAWFARAPEVKQLEGVRDVCRGEIVEGQSTAYYKGVNEQMPLSREQYEAIRDYIIDTAAAEKVAREDGWDPTDEPEEEEDEP